MYQLVLSCLEWPTPRMWRLHCWRGLAYTQGLPWPGVGVERFCLDYIYCHCSSGTGECGPMWACSTGGLSAFLAFSMAWFFKPLRGCRRVVLVGLLCRPWLLPGMFHMRRGFRGPRCLWPVLAFLPGCSSLLLLV